MFFYATIYFLEKKKIHLSFYPLNNYTGPTYYRSTRRKHFAKVITVHVLFLSSNIGLVLKSTSQMAATESEQVPVTFPKWISTQL